MAIAMQREKSRIYLVGDTYPIKDRIKQMGGHWDGDRKQWWVGSSKANEVLELIDNTAQPQTAPERKVSDSSKVIAKAKYKDRLYYVLWMGQCNSGEEKAHLTVLDGSIDFWADLSACEITKRYEPRRKWNGLRGSRSAEVEVYQTLGGIRRFIEQQKNPATARVQCPECDSWHDVNESCRDCGGC